jgi:hypothetical protein
MVAGDASHDAAHHAAMHPYPAWHAATLSCPLGSAQWPPGGFVHRTYSHTVSANLRAENRPPTDCGEAHDCRNKGSVRTLMNNEPTVVEEKKVGRHQAGDSCRVALRNSSIDGHEFVMNVVGSGASAALASDSPRAINSLRDLSLLQVQDTLTKLHKLAPSYRRLMPLRPFSTSVPALNENTATQEPAFVPGHEFLSDVVGSGVLGASTALASDSPRAINSLRDLSLLQVQDTLTKLHKLAPIYRQLMPQPPSSSHLPTWN